MVNILSNLVSNFCAVAPANRVLRRISGIVLLVMLGTVGQAMAGQISVTSGPYRVPVVELYTSEGCSSCPPADQWISKLGEAIGQGLDAVPLAFHVDYWNRLGWKDEFSNKAYTERQQLLAGINKQRSIYTPEFLVSGAETRGTTTVVKAIQQANTELAEAVITLSVDAAKGNTGDNLDANLLINCEVDNAELYLAIYESGIVSEIEAGENNGLTLEHDFVVRYWIKAADLSPGEYQGNHGIMLQPDWNLNNLGFAAIVLDRNTGQTLQALRTDLSGVFTAGS